MVSINTSLKYIKGIKVTGVLYYAAALLTDRDARSSRAGFGQPGIGGKNDSSGSEIVPRHPLMWFYHG